MAEPLGRLEGWLLWRGTSLADLGTVPLTLSTTELQFLLRASLSLRVTFVRPSWRSQNVFNAPFGRPTVATAIAARRMGPSTTPRSFDRCLAARPSPPAHCHGHGRQPPLRTKSTDRDSRGTQSRLRSHGQGESAAHEKQPRSPTSPNLTFSHNPPRSSKSATSAASKWSPSTPSASRTSSGRATRSTR